MIKTINVASEFSKVPTGRYENDGPYNGKAFRERFLVPAMRQNTPIIINLDGLLSYANSFFEEAIGGLCRSAETGGEGFDCSDVRRLVTLHAETPVAKFWVPSILALVPGMELNVVSCAGAA